MKKFKCHLSLLLALTLWFSAPSAAVLAADTTYALQGTALDTQAEVEDTAGEVSAEPTTEETTAEDSVNTSDAGSAGTTADESAETANEGLTGEGLTGEGLTGDGLTEDGLTGGHTGTVSEETVIKDIVTYHNLIPGKEYTVSGVLMNKETGRGSRGTGAVKPKHSRPDR